MNNICDTSHYPNQTEVDAPMGWAKCKLSDVCQFESGFAFKSESYKKEGVPLIRISNIKDGTITTDGGVCIQEVVESRFHVVKGDLLIALSGATTGKMGVYDKDDDALLNQRVGDLRVISKTCFLPEYRNLFMESQAATILEQAWGGAQPNISPNTIIGFDILLPPYAEQCRIVCKANELLALVSNIEFVQDQIETGVDDIKTKVLDLAIHGKLVSQDPSDEPAINLLRRINPDFKASDNLHYAEDLPNNWGIAPLSTFCTTINGLWKGVKDPLINVGVIRNANFTKDFGLDYSKIEYINVELKSFEKRNLEDGDIIVEKSGGSDNFPVGRSIIFNGESRKFSFSNFTMSLRIMDKSMILPKYLYYVLQHKYRRGDMKQMQTQTTGLHNLLTEKFLSSLIPIPPVREQEMIVLAIEDLFQTVDGICDLVKDRQ